MPAILYKETIMAMMGQEVMGGHTPPPVELPPARARRSAHVLDLRAIGAQEGASAPAVSVEAPSAAPKTKKHRRISKRQLLTHALKATIIVAGAIGFLSLDITLAER